MTTEIDYSDAKTAIDVIWGYISEMSKFEAQRAGQFSPEMQARFNSVTSKLNMMHAFVAAHTPVILLRVWVSICAGSAHF